jgi:zinc protease
MIAHTLLLLGLAGRGSILDVPATSAAAADTARDTATVAYEVAGIKVIQRLNPATDVVSARIYLLGGTRQLTPATEGIEHLLLEASAHGTTAFPGDSATLAMALTGSRVILDADADWTVFGFVGLAREFRASWTVLADRLMHPALSEEAVNRARRELLGIARRRYTAPDARLQVLAAQARFEGHPYALDPYGTESSLQKLTVADLQRYLQEQMVRSRLLIVVAGGVERAEVESAVQATLASLPAGDYRWTLPPPAPDLQPRWVVESRALETNYILGYFVGPPPQSKDYPSFVVATRLLSSEVNSLIRDKLGLSYASGAPFFEQGVPFSGIYASSAKPELILPLVQTAVAGLAARVHRQQALAGFVAALLRQNLLDGTSSNEQADQLARAELYYGSWRLAGPNVQRLKEVDAYSVQRAAGKYMRAMSLAFIGDTTRMSGRW